MTTQNGKKFDENKIRWDLLPVYPVEEVVKVFTYGAKKYEDNNWRKIENPHDRYYAALMRHIVSWRKGELIDPESGLPHLAHAITNLIFLMEYDRMSDREEKLTDLVSKKFMKDRKCDHVCRNSTVCGQLYDHEVCDNGLRTCYR